MMKKSIIVLIACTGVAMLVIFILFSFSYRPNSKKNAFNRNFVPGIIGDPKVLNIENGGYYFAGFSETQIYLGSYKWPNRLVTTNFNLSRFDTVTLKNTDPTKLPWASLRLKVDSPNIYLGEGITPQVLQTTIPNSDLIKSYIRTPFFTFFYPLTKESMIIKTYNDSTKKEVFMKIVGDHRIQVSDVLEKQIDGMFCVSGNLTYDKDSGKFFYAYFYRNQFICLDSNLNVLYRHNTLDSNTHAKLEVKTIKSQVQLAAPAIVINRYISADKGRIYINSSLSADNEFKSNFERSSVIDVYNAEDGSYLHSFYLQRYNERKIDDMFIRDNKIIVIHGEYILIYDLST